MCGIAGVRRFGDTPISREELIILMCSLEHRGNHASGIAIANADGHEIAIHKMPEAAWSFMRHDATEGFLAEHLKDDTAIVLLHTRFATCGTPDVNNNNHPMWDGCTAVIHNGSIRNHAELFRSEELTRNCDTDSDIIWAIFDRDGFEPKAARTLSKCYGSAAIAGVSAAYPGVLALGRSGNPLVVADANDKLYFASELTAIHKAVRPWEMRHGLYMRSRATGFAYNNMPDNTLYFIGPKKNGTDDITHHELEICSHFTPPVYRSYDNYAEKKATWTARKHPTREYTSCRNCKTVQYRTSPTSWSNLNCSKCKQSFGYLEVAHAA